MKQRYEIECPNCGTKHIRKYVPEIIKCSECCEGHYVESYELLKECGSCRSWSRGGMGAGRGGGYCLRYMIPAHPQNRLKNDGNNCWEPIRQYGGV